MNFHILAKDYPWNAFMPDRFDLSLNYDLQKYFKIVSKISYIGSYNQIGKMISILSHKS